MVRVDWSDPGLKVVGVDAGGGDIYEYNGIPLTGILFENFPNGNLSYEIECVNGYPDGIQRHYFPNGQINEEYLFRYNVAYGTTKEWDENGNLINEYYLGPKP